MSGTVFHWSLLPDLKNVDVFNYELVSLDIFDTILHRAVKVPQDIFLEVGRRAIAEGLLDSSMTATEFALIRIEMEKVARKTKAKQENTTEVSFAEIWQQAPVYLLQSDKIAELELNVELEFSFPNPYLLSLLDDLRQNGKFIAFTSDTYFDRQFILRMFAKAAIAVNDAELLLSCEHKLNKATGKLFTVLFQRYPDVLPQCILHLGDNLVSDTVQAQRFGITSLYLGGIHRETALTQRHLVLGNATKENPLSTLYRLGNLREPAKNNFFRHFGAALYGPVLAGFCLWVVVDAHRRGVKLLCPIMREAIIFTPLLRAAASALKLDIQVKDFYISRSAAFLPAMQKLDKDAINHFSLRRNYTLKDLVNELKLPDLPENLSVQENSLLISAIEQDDLQQYLYSNEVQAAAEQASTNARELLLQYTKDIFGSAQQVAMIDIGARGNTTNWLNKCLAGTSPITMNYLMFSIPSMAKNALTVPYLTYFPVTQENITRQKQITFSPEVLEILLTGRNSTTTGYELSDSGKVTPKTSRVFICEAQDESLSHFEQGVFIASRHLSHMLNYVSPEILTNMDCRAMALQEIYTLLELPTYTEASLLGKLLFDDNAGVNNYSTICSQNDFNKLNSKGPERFMLDVQHNRGYRGENGTKWPQAVVTCQFPQWLMQRYLDCFNDTDFQLLCVTLVSKVKAENFSKVVIYGGGQLGYQMIDTAMMMGLEVQAVVDSNPALHGLSVNGYPIMSLNDAFSLYDHCYLVASAAFASDITQVIKEYYKRVGRKDVSIFSVAG
ncbi:hypothetical protein [Rheinheimera sp. MMS21-TC3]|uniref:hypothetical protein n=1 Tax=Rheinheimera sp. MMS21-TC3 TaxID=3072790 RepID=UPI0028C4E634|nr:hypothetical protein [Rheinheimera sp. MMS21-TC3]WNO61819.1 hypothetical protein RDV63_12905 [Rheinheimera sp. MMS21-TC3]